MDRLARILLFAALLLAGCQPALTPTLTAAPTSTPLAPTATPAPTATATVTPEPTLTPTPTEVIPPIDTEYTGNYPPEFGQPLVSTQDFEFVVDGKTKTTIPISVGVSADIPIKSAFLTEKGQAFIGDMTLDACYGLYRKYVNKDVTLDQYRELLANGQGGFQSSYRDAITGEIKTQLYDPRNGITYVITADQDDLPFFHSGQAAGAYAIQPQYDIIANNSGRIIFINKSPKETFESDYETFVTKQHYTLEYFYTLELLSNLCSSIVTFRSINESSLTYNKGGYSIINDEYFKLNYENLNKDFENINKTVERGNPYIMIELQP